MRSRQSPRQRNQSRQRRVADLVKHSIRFERQLARAIGTEFNIKASLAAAAFRADGEDGAINVIRQRRGILYSILKVHLWRAASFFALNARRQKKSEDAQTRAMRLFIEHQAIRRADDITAATARRVRKEIAFGVEKGLSTNDIAENIDDVIDDFPRAQTIARTEVHSIANYAQQKEAEQSDEDLVRIWGTAEDDNVRPTHAEADGQVRELDEPFDVGDAKLNYPGDPSGPAEEIINCRCFLLYEVRQ